MSKISDLAQALHQKSAIKKLQWSVDDDNSVVINVSKNSIYIAKFNDHYLGNGYKISIQNLDGDTIDSEKFYPNNDDYKSIDEMFHKARRDALGVDETLDDLLEKIHRM